MAENGNRVEIEVRTLTGESIRVSIPSNTTILHLKILLNKIFPPATSSVNFHLFFKGMKLGLQSQISSHLTGNGEFMVLVPFTKKEKPKTQKPDENAMGSRSLKQCPTSKLAESMWSDMMQDLSTVQETNGNESQPQINSRSLDFSVRNLVDVRKCKSGFDEEVQELLTILKSCGNDEFDEKSGERFIKVLESMDCLSYPESRSCRWSANVQVSRTDCSASGSLCSCPPWLKILMKAFYFLNTYYAFLQLQQKEVAVPYLEGRLNQLRKFGFSIEYANLEHLSIICPQVVHFGNYETDGRFPNVLVIIKSSLDLEDQFKAKKSFPISRIVSSMRKREGTFKTDLWAVVKSLMNKKGNEINSFSLEDVLLHVNEDRNKATKKNVKRTRGSSSEASSSFSSEGLCNETNPLSPAEMLEHLRAGIGSQGQIVHVEEITGRIANFVEIPSDLSESTTSALKSCGVNKLYSHQADSIQCSLAGKDVVVSTMTSSGKSLCYNLPVLEVLSQNPAACALYLFPTKALAQDQLRALLSMTERSNVGLNMGIYDGDTPKVDRMWLRDNARLLITNPDMLHMSILPVHGHFRRILSNLRYVVIDEAHAYKGAFGCHTALILRRLRRLCAHVYGSDPSFIFCTATSANPRDHAMELASLPTIELIHKDGSPSGPKLFVLWNPPLCLKAVKKNTERSINTNDFTNRDMLGRASPMLQVSYLFAEMVQHGLRCIAFCKTRKLCELVLSYTREILQKTAPHLVNSIFAYRAGYTAQDRRRIESDFFGGKICGVAATNALELGIDVGHIDVTLHLGFPGSIASLWQQAGRSGRREQPSLAIYVAFEGPLDQYFMKFPQKLFRAPIECCHVDAKNQQVLEQHLLCASLEHPLSVLHDEKYFGPGLKNLILILKEKGGLSTDSSRDPSAEIWNYIGKEKMPSRAVSIRAIETERYQVIDVQTDEVLEEIEESRAFFQVYEGAVYMQQGKTYLVENLDLSNKIAYCQKANLEYYTTTRDYTDIHVIGGHIAYPASISNDLHSRTTAQSNPCKVTTNWFGFRRIRRRSNEVFDTVELSLPSYTYESQAVWIRVPQSIKTAVESKQYSFRAGLHAAGHALLNVVPLFIICNSSDLASECVNPFDTRYIPERILLYDSRPGGTGISVQVRPIFTELLTAALELLTSCGCHGDAGCPNCVQSFCCHEYNEELHKDAAIMITQGVLELERSKFGDTTGS